MKAQGSLEYLLFIGGAILVSVIVVSAVLEVASSSNNEGFISIFNKTVKALTGIDPSTVLVPVDSADAGSAGTTGITGGGTGGTGITGGGGDGSGGDGGGGSGTAGTGISQPPIIPTLPTKPATPTIIFYSLSVAVSPAAGGSVDRNVSRPDYNAGETVLLTAVPSIGWRFVGWSGGVSGDSNKVVVLMDSNKNITAVFSLISPPGSLEERDLIGSWTKSVLPGETVLLVGKNLDTGSVVVSDGVQEAQAAVLMREGQKLMAVVPSSLGSGTLRLKLQASSFVSNEVLLNAPEPWWVQPDKLSIGESTRIFGRNLNSAGANAAVGDNVAIVLKNSAGVDFNYTGTVVEPNAIRFTVSGSIPYGDYNLFIKEPKNSTLYGSIKLTLEAPYVIPSYEKSVLDFGAVANDGLPDNTAFYNAIGDVSNHGGGTVYVPAGTYLFGQPSGSPWRSIQLRQGVHLRGDGIDSTIIEFNHQPPIIAVVFRGLVLLENSSVEGMTLKVTSNKLSTNNDDIILYINGRSAKAKNVKIDTDSSRLHRGLTAILLDNCNYCKVEDSSIYSPGYIRFAGRQIELKNITHYGVREMQYYDLSTLSEPRWYSTTFFTTQGNSSEIIVENNNAVSRWAEQARPEWQGVNRGNIRRFLTSGADHGPFRRVYFGNNTADVIPLPFSDSENFLMEPACDSFYVGGFTVDGEDKTLIRLNTAISGIHLWYIRNLATSLPLQIAVIDGAGLGQVREGFLQSDNQTIKINEKLIIEPDSASRLVVQWAVSENIIYGNDFQSRNLYSTGSYGIVFYGKVMNQIVRNNKITGFPIGFADTVESCNHGAVDDQTQAGYFNEFIGNEINGSLNAIQTNYLIPLPPSPNPPLLYWDPFMLLGNVYKRNVIKDMNLNLPMLNTNNIPLAAIGISNNRVDKTRPSATTVVGSIYEFNDIDSSRRAFYTEKNFADWLVVRKNNFSNPKIDGIKVVDAMPHAYLLENQLNVVPQITIISSSDPSNIKFKCLFGNLPTTNPAHAAEQVLLTDTDCYIWSSTGSGSVNLSFSDLEGNPIIGKSVSGSATLSGDSLSWSSLNSGVHELIVSASDGTATGERKIYLIVGAFDGFESPTSVSSCSAPCVYRVQTPLTTYYTKTTTEIFNANHNHCALYDNDAKLLIIKPRREEVSFKTTASAGSASKAVLAFLKNHWSCNNSPYIKLRLLQDELNYYEFFDFCDYNAFNPFVKTRQIIKVVNGNPALKAEKMAAHASESPVMFEKNGTKIKATFWGDSIEMTDSSPLSISDWEISVAGNPPVPAGAETCDNSLSGASNAIFSTITNLLFAKGEGISTTIPG